MINLLPNKVSVKLLISLFPVKKSLDESHLLFGHELSTQVIESKPNRQYIIRITNSRTDKNLAQFRKTYYVLSGSTIFIN